jgi:hypothetical protein
MQIWLYCEAMLTYCTGHTKERIENSDLVYLIDSGDYCLNIPELMVSHLCSPVVSL